MTGGKTPESSPTPPPLDNERPTPDSGATVNLPALISDIFGTPRSEVRLHIALGTVEIDGEEYTGKNRMDIPVSLLSGKQIRVVSDMRTYTFDYAA